MWVECTSESWITVDITNCSRETIQNQENIRNNTIIKDPTTPLMCRYTIPREMSMFKSIEKKTSVTWNWSCWCTELSSERVPSTGELSSNQLCHHFQGFVRQRAPRQSSSYRVYAPSQLLRPGCMVLTACRHPEHHEQTNFQNITWISFLLSSFWYFIVTAVYC